MKIETAIVIGFCIFLSFTAQALTSEESEKLFFEKLKKYDIAKSDIGTFFSIGEGENSKTLISHNHTGKMIPASLTKIVTSSAVLSVFPPGTKFKTQLYLNKKPNSTSSKGALYLKGAGDPSFVSENMWFLVNVFKRNGVDSIDGDIVVDDSVFDDTRYDESRESVRVDRAYDAPVGGMSFNWNSINIFVRPGAKGQKAQVILDPENSYTKLENKTKTVAGEKIKLEVSRKIKPDHDLLVLDGVIGEEVREHVIYKNITRPDLWSGNQLKSFLQQRGIQVKGQVRTGKVPSDAYLAAESESKPIEEILVDMNKFSNNYVAEMLCKNLGLTKAPPGKIETGMGVIREHLQSLGIASKDYELFNPSGLTRDNKMSAEALWRVLKHLREDFRVQPELLRSLPIAGIDGTLKKRMKDSPAERWVRAKTGLLNGVVALAGYAGRKDGTPLTFVLIYNGSQNEAKVRQFYDDLLVDMVSR